MTFRGSSGFGAALFLFVAFTLALLVWQSSADEVSAQTTYIEGDWVIQNETVTLRNETVDVSGDVTIGEGGRLIMVNSSLVMNTTVGSGQDMLVDKGGYLKCLDSVIEGGRSHSFLRILNDTLLINTEVEHFQGWQSDPGVKLEDGRVELHGSRFMSGVRAWTDILFVNSCASYWLELEYGHPDIDRDLSWVIRDLDVDKGGSSIIIKCTYGPYHDVDLLIENVSISERTLGIQANIFQGLNMTIRDCKFENAGNAIVINERYGGGRCTIINNTIAYNHEATSKTGFKLWLSRHSNLTLINNTIDGASTAYNVRTRSPSLSISLDNLSATNSSYHMIVYSDYEDGLPDFHVVVRNSSFKGGGVFYVGPGASLTLFDTEHIPGFCIIDDGARWARAYTYLDIGSVGWLNGPEITSGRLLLMDDEDNVVRNYLVDSLEPELIVGWEMTPDIEFVYEDLIPTISQGGRTFSGVPIDIWGKMPVPALIIDDAVPFVNITTPAMGHHHGEDAITIGGTYTEEGTGIGSITYSLGTSEPIELTGYSSGSWAISFKDLPDGEHIFTITAVDNVGNVAESTMVIFTIDTIVPYLEMDDPPTDTNSSELVVTGRTESNARVLLNGVEHNIRADGSFEFSLYLREGPNHFSVVAEDRAGNHNMTDFQVLLDTIPPYLLVESPWNGSWITAWEVLVEGETEPGAHLEIEGEKVEHIRGAFEHVVSLPFGEYHLHIDVRDAAGNSYHRVIVLFADWEPPRITIESPNRTTVLTNEDTVFILGTAEDEYLDVVRINGEVVPAPEGTFLKECDLEMGPNVFEVSVTDLAGNRISVTFTIIMDVEHPECSCELRAVDGELTAIGHRIISSTSQLRLSIQASEPVFVTVAQRRFGPSARMLIDLDLEEGANDIVVVVSDRAGNEAIPYEYDVIVDTIPPKLTVTTSVTGLKTERDSITIYGYTEAGVGLTIDGVRRSVKHDGTFEEDLPLEVGVNVFEVTATDLAGNTNSMTVTIERVEPAPDYRTGLVGLGLLLILAAVVLVLVVMPFSRNRRERKVT